MLEPIFYWTGVAVWVAGSLGLIWLMSVILREAFISIWHVVRVYRHGWLRDPNRIWLISLTYPVRLWWYFFWNGPIYFVRIDRKGGHIYRPGRKPDPNYYAD